jgi:predicted RND superfamily exporter protein
MYLYFVMVACLLYMIIHTRSLFLAIVSLLNILMSIPIALCIYTYIFRVTYFSSIHVAVIIIIIGIGSDDIFVFHDCWQASFHIMAIKDKPIRRLSYCYRMAAKQMFVTSLTSSVAFLSCLCSKLMPIRAFGVFATIVVLVCFVLTINF